MGVGGQCHSPANLPRERDPVPIVLEAGWALGTVWTGAENLAPPTGFNPWTIQPIASRYTNYVIPAHHEKCNFFCEMNDQYYFLAVIKEFSCPKEYTCLIKQASLGGDKSSQPLCKSRVMVYIPFHVVTFPRGKSTV